MIKKILFICFNLSLICFIFSCSSNRERYGKVNDWMRSDKIKVLSTIEMIDDLVKVIGGEHVTSLVLITGQLDPHSYQLVKGDDEKFAIADIIFYNGLTLEHGPSLKKTLEEKKNSIGLGDAIREENPNLILEYNGQVDPHIWMDMSLWSKTIPFIVETLSKYDPSHKDVFIKNGEKLTRDLEKAHHEIYEMLQKIPEEKRYLVTSHDAFNYFTRSYLATNEERNSNTWQKRFRAPEGLAPDSQLSTSDIKDIVDHLQKYHIQVLFPESNLSHDSINKIVEAGKGKGLNLTIATCPLYADAMGSPGSDGDSYVKMVQHNAKLIGLYLRDYNPRAPIKCEE